MSSSSSNPKKRQRYAIRSCLACRKRKVRCQLVNVEVPSSLEPLKKEDSCERCKKMKLDCIVWDGERKGKRYTIPIKDDEEKEHSLGDHLNTTTTTATTTTTDGDQILSPFYPFKPTFGQKESDLNNSEDTVLGDENESIEQESSSSQAKMMNGKVKLMAILRNPMLMMIQILERQDKFRCGLPSFGIESILEKDLNLSFLSKEVLEVCDLGLIIQHPHLPRLQKLNELCKSNPTTSKKLLLYIMMFLCRIWEGGIVDQSMSKTIPINLIKLIHHYSLQVILRLPQTIEAAQSLELLAVHLPFLLYVGEADEGKTENSRRFPMQEENFTPGSTLITLAIKIVHSLNEIGTMPKIKQILKISLHSWELAFSFHNHFPIGQKSLNMTEQIFQEFDITGEDRIIDNQTSSPDEIIRKIGHQALLFRSKTVFETAKCDIEGERSEREAKSDEEMKLNQSKTLDEYFETIQDQSASRCKELNRINKEILEKFSSNPYRDLIQSLTKLTWLWLDLESNGIHQILLSKALGNMHLFILRNKKESNISVGQKIKSINEIYKLDFRQRIWENPEWSEHVSEYGKRRNKVMLSFIAFSCQLKEHFQEVRFSLEKIQSISSSNSFMICHTFIPVTILSAILVQATKSLLDTQIVLLQAWNHLHEDTDIYKVLIRQSAENLEDDEMCIQIIDQKTGKVEENVGKCCSDILRLIVLTMSDWQEKQNFVLAKHRIEEKRRKEKEDQREKNSLALQSFGMNENSNSENSNLVLQNPIPTESGDPSNSTPFIFDCMPTINSIFEGILDIPPEWNDFMMSFDQQ